MIGVCFGLTSPHGHLHEHHGVVDSASLDVTGLMPSNLIQKQPKQQGQEGGGVGDGERAPT